MLEENALKRYWNAVRSNPAFMAISAAIVLVLIGIIILLVNGYVNKFYNNYEVIRETERQDGGTEQYLCQNGRIFKYSKDGISEINDKGTTLWNGSYEMSNPFVKLCGKHLLVADIGGKDAVIFDEDNKSVELTVDYEIRQADISRQGLVALLLEDSSSDMINVYNPYDVASKLLVEIPTNVDDGYPVGMALSPDGMNVVAAYASVASGKLESRVVFYNFTDVGKNKDCLVGAKNYTDSLVTDVHFLSDDQVCLFADTGYYVWTNMKRPRQVMSKTTKSRIRSAFYDDKNIGLVLESKGTKEPYQMEIYNLRGRKVTEFRFSYEYSHIELVNHEILFYSTKQCGIFRLNGVLRFHKVVEDGIDYFFSSPHYKKYYLLNSQSFQKIKLINTREHNAS